MSATESEWWAVCGLPILCNVARYSQYIMVYRVHNLAVSGEGEGIEADGDGRLGYVTAATPVDFAQGRPFGGAQSILFGYESGGTEVAVSGFLDAADSEGVAVDLAQVLGVVNVGKTDDQTLTLSPLYCRNAVQRPLDTSVGPQKLYRPKSNARVTQCLKCANKTANTSPRTANNCRPGFRGEVFSVTLGFSRSANPSLRKDVTGRVD